MWILMELKEDALDINSIDSYVAIGYASSQSSAYRWREKEPSKRFYIYCKRKEYIFNEK